MRHACPSCECTFPTQRGVKIHHFRIHGASLKPTVPCANCGNILYRKASRLKKSKRHFCNHKCMSEWQSVHQRGSNNPTWNRLSLVCDHCGASFFKAPNRVKRAKYHFCSNQCRRDWFRSQSEKRIESLECDHCGTQFKRKDYESARAENHFCSYECSREYLKNRIMIECKFCGGMVERLASHVQIRMPFCSHNCRAAWQSQNGRMALTCDTCGIAFEKKLSQFNKTNHHFCSRDCFHAWFREANHPFYEDGSTDSPYPAEFSSALKRRIRERDEHTCQLCGKARDEEGRNLAVHHIDYDKTNNLPSNLITLCNSCNIRCNHDRLGWQLWLEDYQHHRGYDTEPQAGAVELPGIARQL